MEGQDNNQFPGNTGSVSSQPIFTPDPNSSTSSASEASNLNPSTLTSSESSDLNSSAPEATGDSVVASAEVSDASPIASASTESVSPVSESTANSAQDYQAPAYNETPDLASQSIDSAASGISATQDEGFVATKPVDSAQSYSETQVSSDNPGTFPGVSTGPIFSTEATPESNSQPDFVVGAEAQVGTSQPTTPISSTPTPETPQSFSANPFRSSTFSGSNRAPIVSRNSIPAPAETGDIILSRDRSSNSPKKWPLIAAAAAIVGAVILVVIVSIFSGSGASNPSSDNNLGEQKFNEFATYLLYGESKPELTGEYDRWTSYKLDQNLGEDADDEYWSTSIGLLNNLIDSYNGKDDEASQLIQESLKAYRADLIFVDEVRKLKEPTFEDITNAYLASGQKIAESRITNTYSDLSEPLPYQGEIYVGYKKEAYQFVIKRMEEYQKADCIVSNRITENCPNLDTSAVEQFSMDFLTNESFAEKTFSLIVNNLASRCWSLSEFIKNPSAAPKFEEVEDKKSE